MHFVRINFFLLPREFPTNYWQARNCYDYVIFLFNTIGKDWGCYYLFFNGSFLRFSMGTCKKRFNDKVFMQSYLLLGVGLRNDKNEKNNKHASINPDDTQIIIWNLWKSKKCLVLLTRETHEKKTLWFSEKPLDLILYILATAFFPR